MSAAFPCFRSKDRQYPHDDKLIGPYAVGENRTQIVFAGFDGGYADSSTLTGSSG